MSDARTQNMKKRRERILEEARKTLAAGGFDALNLRDLADVSGITVPTIYNLIGNKAAVLKALVMGYFADYEVLLEKQLPCPTRQFPALMVRTFADMIAQNEDYHRATALASERMESESGELSDYGFKRAPLRKFASRLCQCAKEEELLRGEIESELLVEHMIASHQIAFRDWAHHVISLEELGRQSLAGFYIALAADAVDEFRAEITEALTRL